MSTFMLPTALCSRIVQNTQVQKTLERLAHATAPYLGEPTFIVDTDVVSSPRATKPFMRCDVTIRKGTAAQVHRNRSLPQVATIALQFTASPVDGFSITGALKSDILPEAPEPVKLWQAAELPEGDWPFEVAMEHLTSAGLFDDWEQIALLEIAALVDPYIANRQSA